MDIALEKPKLSFIGAFGSKLSLNAVETPHLPVFVAVANEEG
jgi:hypothetical protein